MTYCMNCKSTQCANIKLKCKAGFTFIGGVRIPVGYCMVKAGVSFEVDQVPGVVRLACLV